MANYGLAIGINDYPGTGSDLAGCVNDALDWEKLLSPACAKFDRLLDSDATRANIISALTGLLARLHPGDWGFIQFSGHGSWIRDKDGDEPDGRDEVLVPADWENVIRDDELHSRILGRREGSYVMLVSDSCHSGTVFRMFSGAGGLPADGAEPPKIRFLPPYLFLPADEVKETEQLAARVKVPKTVIAPGFVHLAGCGDTQYSYDASFSGRYNGAFSYVALAALKKLKAKSNFTAWMTAIRKSLPSTYYPQTPRLNSRPADAKLPLPWSV